MRPSPTVTPGRIPTATLVAALGSAATNVAIWFAGEALDRMTIGWEEVVIFSALGAAAGGAVFAALGRFAQRPVRRFAAVTIAVLLVYALGPVSALYAPYMEGAELFNVTTLLATEVMHLVSGAWVYLSLTRRATA